MGDRATKDALFAEFAAVGKALGNAKRLELLDLLAQGPRSVDDLATAAQVGVSTCSAHLQTMREAGLVDTRREGKRIFYSLAGDDVAGLWDHLRRVAQRHRPHTELARRAYLGPEDTDRRRHRRAPAAARGRGRHHSRRAARPRIRRRPPPRSGPHSARRADRTAGRTAHGPGDRRLLPWPVLRARPRRRPPAQRPRNDRPTRRRRRPGMETRRPAHRDRRRLTRHVERDLQTPIIQATGTSSPT